MGVVRLLPLPDSATEEEGRSDGLSDGQLVLLAREGQRDAQELLFRRHVRRAAGLAQRLLAGDPSEVDDLLQDVFVIALTKLDELKQPQAFGSWLGSIVVRTASKRLRRRRLGQRLGFFRREEINMEDFSLPHHGSDTLLELRRIYTRLERFPADERVALLLRRVEGMEIAEIADQTGTSVSTIKRRLQRAAQRVQRLGQEESRS